jgi:Ca2+-binding EF-hand superfamily protein
MGGTISSKGVIDNKLKSDIAKLTIKNIMEIKQLLDSTYAESFDLSKTEVQTIFVENIDSWEILYNSLKGDNERCDIYQMLSVLVIFSTEQFHEKQKALFSLFDFDNSGDISLSELVLLFTSCIIGLCKVTNAKPPAFELIKSLSTRAWNIIDTDFSGVIDYDEFTRWIESDEEIQEFLIYYQNFQTKDHAFNRYKFYIDKFIDCFNSAITPDSDKTTKIDFKLLHTNIELIDNLKQFAFVEGISVAIKGSKVFDHLNFNDYLLMISIFKKHGDRIQLTFYNNLIRAVSSFLATDLNNDKQISYDELKSLLWLTNGEEPSKERLKKELNAIDLNHDDGIELKEWIDYLLVCDNVTGVYYFDRNLKFLFDKYDLDKSGELSHNEIYCLLKDSVQDQLALLDGEKKKQFEQYIEKMTIELMKETDADSNKSIDWVEFKKGITQLLKKKEHVDKFFNVIK